MNGFYQFKQFILQELEEKGGITEADIGLLDSGTIDLVDDHLAFDFSLRDKDGLFTFWHDYQNEIGTITINEKNEQEREVYKDWGDWSIYEQDYDNDNDN